MNNTVIQTRAPAATPPHPAMTVPEEDPEGLDDDALMARFAQGHHDAFGVLMRRHQRAVSTFVLGMVGRAHRDLAADITQDVFARVIRAAPSYEPQGRLRPWLLTIAKRRCLDVLQSKRHRLEQPTDTIEPTAAPQGGPDARLRHDQLSARLDTALAALTGRQKQVFHLHRAGLAHAEIAETLSLSEGAIKYHLHEARARLRSHLAEFLT